jgi:hypothetical protein
MEDIHFLDPRPWNSAEVDEFPAYPLEFRGFFTNFQPTPWNFHSFLMNFYSSLGNSTDGFDLVSGISTFFV